MLAADLTEPSLDQVIQLDTNLATTTGGTAPCVADCARSRARLPPAPPTSRRCDVVERGGPKRKAGDVVLRVDVHVRPRSSTTRVAGTHDGVLVVRVSEPAHDGRANRAVLHALTDALGLPTRSAKLLHGATARRKVVGLTVPLSDQAAVAERLERLRSGVVRGQPGAGPAVTAAQPRVTRSGTAHL